MKKILSILVLCLCLNNSLFSQNINNPKSACATETPDKEERFRLERALDRVAEMRNTGTNCIPIKFHVVRENDGTGGATLEELAIGVANLNYLYLDSDIEFYICGDINYIDNSDFYDFKTQSPDDDTEAEYCDPEDVSNAVNVYVTNIIEIDGFAAAGYAYFPFDNIQSTRIFMRISVMTNAPNSTFTHEFGHHYSLYHTHQGTENGNTHPDAERVPRSGPQADCDVDGDLLCDTDADPRYNSGNFDLSSCTYTGNEMDDLGNVYNPPVNNIMSYYPDQCGGIFTAEQDARIDNGYMVRQGHTSYDFSCSPATVNAPTIDDVSVNYTDGAIDITWTDNASNELGYLIERSSTSSASDFRNVVYGGVGADATQFTDSDVDAFTRYWYRVKAINGDCNNYSNVLSDSVGLIHCVPTFQDDCNNSPVYADDFNITNSTPPLSNTGSGCSTSGSGSPKNYINYKGTISPVTLEAGSLNTYDWTMNGTNVGFIALFIDHNSDSDFDDDGELLYKNNSSFSGTGSGTFTLDSSAIPGNSIFRVRVANTNEITDACMYTPFGEIEDYEVEIVNNIPTIHETQGCVVSVENVSGSSFTQFFFNGNLIAEINPNGQDLGEVTVDVNDLNSVQQTTSNQYYLPRNWNISSTNQPTSDVTVRLYAMDEELDSYNNAAGTSFNAGDLIVSYFDNDAMDDCDYSNNDRNSGTEGTAVSTALNYDVATTNGFYKEFQIDHFTEFTLAGAPLLPVNFISFDAEQKDEHVQLDWKATTSLNCATYKIQKSENGNDYKTLKTLSCGESLNKIQAYNYRDMNPASGENYYRIKQIDNDGQYVYSDTRIIYRKTDAEKITFRPNPVNSTLLIDFNQDELKNSMITMYSSTGQLVLEKELFQVTETYTIDCSKLNAGVYIIKILLGSGNVKAERIIVQ